ncbi:DUF6325 family protein [Microbacterium sp. M]|uniref:DUF6325 family protein n=1 Tax=Microbacterium sp. M TaxID=3377125 RepID=UPI00386CDFB9
MDDLEFGPVEFVLADFAGEMPDPLVIEAIAQLVDAGTVRLIDLLHVSRDADGTVRWLEVDDAGIELGSIDLAASGLVSHEDVEELAEGLPPGRSALLLAVELLWAKHLASAVVAAGGRVVDSVRIPAPIVNAVVAEAVGV